MIRTRLSLITGVFLLLLITTQSIPGRAAVQKTTSRKNNESPLVAKSKVGFEQLRDVRFQTTSDLYTTYFTPHGMILAGFTSHAKPKIGEPPQYFELQILLPNALPNVEISTLNPRLARTDFFGSSSPSWLISIPNYAKVKYANLYPNVDMLFQIHQLQINFDFVIAPGGDPGGIRFAVQGAEYIRLTADGALLLNIGDVTFEVPKPEGYQAFDNSPARAVVDAQYVLDGNEIALHLAPYDSRRTLIINR